MSASEKKAPLTEIWYVLHGRTLYEYKQMVKSKRKFNKLLIIYIHMTKLHMERSFYPP